MHRFPAFIERGWALRTTFGPVLDIRINEFAGNATVGVGDAPPGDHPRTTDMAPVTCDRDAPHGHHRLWGMEVQYAQHTCNHSCAGAFECELPAQAGADDRHCCHGGIGGRDMCMCAQESNEVVWDDVLREGGVRVVCSASSRSRASAIADLSVSGEGRGGTSSSSYSHAHILIHRRGFRLDEDGIKDGHGQKVRVRVASVSVARPRPCTSASARDLVRPRPSCVRVRWRPRPSRVRVRGTSASTACPRPRHVHVHGTSASAAVHVRVRVCVCTPATRRTTVRSRARELPLNADVRRS